ncbi:Lsr2 dimerization domain-containing protein [Rhodococcus opacus]|uniref:Lsr2 dimerization domain-containing protein n=1 Tax=Rhodococcus opacus TaxID=37919 RepID=A0A076EEQ5_RHOOP|nr:histone-like nucleoid-structuring protein Lsr2 [Rhodococcus opacus]AII04775.1 hypothetical protein EP51_09255 [Rhodococcus opacus]
MGIQEIKTFKIIDDFDGTEIETDQKPEPIQIVWQGTGYNLYMSDANAKKFSAQIEKVIKSADTFEPARSSAVGTKSPAQEAVEAAGDTFQQVKSWAVAQGLKGANGNPITERAPRISPEAWQKYAEAHDIAVK